MTYSEADNYFINYFKERLIKAERIDLPDRIQFLFGTGNTTKILAFAKIDMIFKNLTPDDLRFIFEYNLTYNVKKRKKVQKK